MGRVSKHRYSARKQAASARARAAADDERHDLAPPGVAVDTSGDISAAALSHTRPLPAASVSDAPKTLLRLLARTKRLQQPGGDSRASAAARLKKQAGSALAGSRVAQLPPIQPGESMRDFNARVNAASQLDMVSSGPASAAVTTRRKERMRAFNSQQKLQRQRKRRPRDQQDSDSELTVDAVQFGDVVQAPPAALSLSRKSESAIIRRRLATSSSSSSVTAASDGGMRAQQLLDETRLNVIQLYRDQKQQQRQRHG